MHSFINIAGMPSGPVGEPLMMKKKYRKKLLKIHKVRANNVRHLSFEDLRNTKVRTRRNRKIKRIIFIDAGIHAREWIAPAVATYVAQKLAKAGKSFLRRVTVILVPAVNPDGYEYSHTTNRYWRKNRQKTTDPLCPGVDLNRNWGIAWGDPAGSSSNPCSNTYHGTSNFSELETQAVRDLALVWIDRVTLYISLHSSGNVIMYPWSYMDYPSPKEEKLAWMARKMAEYLGRQNQTFAYGQTGRVMYSASGTSEDFMHTAGVEYTYTLELPEESFILDPKKILPISEAIWYMLVCIIGDIANERKLKAICRGN